MKDLNKIDKFFSIVNDKSGREKHHWNLSFHEKLEILQFVIDGNDDDEDNDLKIPKIPNKFGLVLDYLSYQLTRVKTSRLDPLCWKLLVHVILIQSTNNNGNIIKGNQSSFCSITPVDENFLISIYKFPFLHILSLILKEINDELGKKVNPLSNSSLLLEYITQLLASLKKNFKMDILPKSSIESMSSLIAALNGSHLISFLILSLKDMTMSQLLLECLSSFFLSGMANPKKSFSSFCSKLFPEILVFHASLHTFTKNADLSLSPTLTNQIRSSILLLQGIFDRFIFHDDFLNDYLSALNFNENQLKSMEANDLMQLTDIFNKSDPFTKNLFLSLQEYIQKSHESILVYSSFSFFLNWLYESCQHTKKEKMNLSVKMSLFLVFWRISLSGLAMKVSTESIISILDSMSALLQVLHRHKIYFAGCRLSDLYLSHFRKCLKYIVEFSMNVSTIVDCDENKTSFILMMNVIESLYMSIFQLHPSFLFHNSDIAKNILRLSLQMIFKSSQLHAKYLVESDDKFNMPFSLLILNMVEYYQKSSKMVIFFDLFYSSIPSNEYFVNIPLLGSDSPFTHWVISHIKSDYSKVNIELASSLFDTFYKACQLSMPKGILVPVDRGDSSGFVSANDSNNLFIFTSTLCRSVVEIAVEDVATYMPIIDYLKEWTIKVLGHLNLDGRGFNHTNQILLRMICKLLLPVRFCSYMKEVSMKLYDCHCTWIEKDASPFSCFIKNEIFFVIYPHLDQQSNETYLNNFIGSFVNEVAATQSLTIYQYHSIVLCIANFPNLCYFASEENIMSLLNLLMSFSAFPKDSLRMSLKKLIDPMFLTANILEIPVFQHGVRNYYLNQFKTINLKMLNKRISFETLQLPQDDLFIPVPQFPSVSDENGYLFTQVDLDNLFSTIKQMALFPFSWLGTDLTKSVILIASYLKLSCANCLLNGSPKNETSIMNYPVDGYIKKELEIEIYRFINTALTEYVPGSFSLKKVFFVESLIFALSSNSVFETSKLALRSWFDILVNEKHSPLQHDKFYFSKAWLKDTRSIIKVLIKLMESLLDRQCDVSNLLLLILENFVYPLLIQLSVRNESFASQMTPATNKLAKTINKFIRFSLETLFTLEQLEGWKRIKLDNLKSNSIQTLEYIFRIISLLPTDFSSSLDIDPNILEKSLYSYIFSSVASGSDLSSVSVSLHINMINLYLAILNYLLFQGKEKIVIPHKGILLSLVLQNVSISSYESTFEKWFQLEPSESLLALVHYLEETGIYEPDHRNVIVLISYASLFIVKYKKVLPNLEDLSLRLIKILKILFESSVERVLVSKWGDDSFSDWWSYLNLFYILLKCYKSLIGLTNSHMILVNSSILSSIIFCFSLFPPSMITNVVINEIGIILVHIIKKTENTLVPLISLYIKCLGQFIRFLYDLTRMDPLNRPLSFFEIARLANEVIKICTYMSQSKFISGKYIMYIILDYISIIIALPSASISDEEVKLKVLLQPAIKKLLSMTSDLEKSGIMIQLEPHQIPFFRSLIENCS